MGLDPGVDFIKKIWCEFTYSILKARSFNDREKQCFSHQNGLAYIKVWIDTFKFFGMGSHNYFGVKLLTLFVS